jgi:hypothetical protein
VRTAKLTIIVFFFHVRTPIITSIAFSREALALTYVHIRAHLRVHIGYVKQDIHTI